MHWPVLIDSRPEPLGNRRNLHSPNLPKRVLLCRILMCMSRRGTHQGDFGATQRRILAELAQPGIEWIPITVLAGTDRKSDDHKYTATKQAIRLLVDAGLVEKTVMQIDGRGQSMIHVRITAPPML
jgi:hypothetical protein